MTFVTHYYGSGASVSLPNAQAGDTIVVVSNQAPTNGWLSALVSSAPYVYAGVYPGSGGVTFSGSTLYLVLIYRPGANEAISVQALANTTSGTTHTTPTINLPATGQVWGICSGSDTYTWQTSGSPSSTSAALAYMRRSGGDLAPGSYSLTATTPRSSTSDNRTIAISATPASRVAASESTSGAEALRVTTTPQDTAGATEEVITRDITPFIPWYQGAYQAGWRVEFWDGATWRDISNDLLGVDIRDDIDSPGPTATLILDRKTWHPDDTALDLTAPVRIWGSIAPLSGSPVYEWPLLYGYVGAIDTASPQMTVDVYHASEPLLARWIETGLNYNSTDLLPTRIQKILDAAVPDLNISLYAPGVTAAVGPQRMSVQPVWKAIEDLAALTGHKLRWRWDGTTWRLTLYEPPRTKTTPDYSLSANVWLGIRRLRRGVEDVRNVIQVSYGRVGNRYAATVQDDVSIAKYGRRWARIVEASDSQIDTPAEAQRLATAILSDLREPVAEVEAELHWAPFLRIHDLVTLVADGNVLKQNLNVAISGIRHSLRRGQARTYITGRGQNPPGYYRYWLQREAGRPANVPGVPPNIGRPPAPATAPSSLTVAPTARGLQVIVPAEYDPGYLATELQISTDSSFSQAQSYVMAGFATVLTAWPDGTALTPGTTYYLRSRYLYRDGRSSPWSNTASAVMGKLVDGGDSYTSQSSFYIIPDSTFSDVPGASVSFTLTAPSGVLLWYHVEAEGMASVDSVAENSNVGVGVSVEARLTTNNTGGGVLDLLHVDSTRRVGESLTLYASSPRAQISSRGTLAWLRLYTLPAGSYTIQLQARRIVLGGSGVTVSGGGYLYGRGVGVLIMR